MYQFDSRVRFSETDRNGKLTLEGIVDYFQDCSTFQTEDLGVGFSYLQPKGLTWVLSYWQIVVDEYSSLGDKITIATLPYEFKGFLGSRNFCIFNEQGKRIVCANSLWTLLNIEKQIPQRITEERLARYPKEEKMEMEYASRKIIISGEEQKQEPVIIQKHHLDCNNHVNNGQYIRICATYLPEDYPIRQMRAEYRKQAILGDMLYPYCYEEENKIIISLCDSEKKPYTIVEFTRKENTCYI